MNYFEEDEYQDSKFDINIWLKIFSFMKPFKRNVILGVLAAIVLAGVDTIYPLINKYAIDEIIETGSLEKLPYFIAFYVVIMFLIGFMVYGFIIQAGQVQQKLSFSLRKRAFKRLHELPFSYYDKTPVGWIMARMTSDSRKLSEILSWGLIDLSWGLLMMVGITIAMFILNFKLALITLSVLPILVVLSIYFKKKILKFHKKDFRP